MSEKSIIKTKVKIICDSGSDFTNTDAEKLGVRVVPLKITIDGESLLDDVEISGTEFYKRLPHLKENPVTSQANPAEFDDIFTEELENAESLLVITVASRLSGTYQSASIAAARFPGSVIVVDSRSVSVGEACVIKRAAELRDEGRSAIEIANELGKIIPALNVVARVDTLEYLVRGGRMSSAAGFVGTVLNIKPVLLVKNGEIKKLGKARGTKQSHNLLTEHVAKLGGIDYSLPYMVAYSGESEDALNEYMESCKSLWEGKANDIRRLQMGSVIGTHAGPGAVAVAFFEDNK